MKKFDVTANGIYFTVNSAQIKRGVGVDETFNHVVRKLYNELMEKPETVGCGYSDYHGFKSVGIYRA